MVPKYRNEIAGNIAAIRAEFRECLKGEFYPSPFAISEPPLTLAESSAYHEYRDFLTADEMESDFERIAGHKSRR